MFFNTPLGLRSNDRAKSLLRSAGKPGGGVTAIEGDGCLEAAEVGKAIRATLEVLFDPAAPGRIQSLIEIVADMPEYLLVYRFF